MPASDPFKDDELRSPPPPPADARNLRQNSNILTRQRLTYRTLEPAEVVNEVPAVIENSVVRHVNAEAPVVRTVSAVQPAAVQARVANPLPKNPLRD